MIDRAVLAVDDQVVPALVRIIRQREGGRELLDSIAGKRTGQLLCNGEIPERLQFRTVLRLAEAARVRLCIVDGRVKLD